MNGFAKKPIVKTCADEFPGIYHSMQQNNWVTIIKEQNFSVKSTHILSASVLDFYQICLHCIIYYGLYTNKKISTI